MSRLPRSTYLWRGRWVSPTIPAIGDPDETYAPPQPGDQGEQWYAAIGPFPGPGQPVVLWSARIESLSIRDRTLGGNTVTVSVPADEVSMRILGEPLSGARDAQGRMVYHVDDAVGWEVLVGSNVDGKVRHRFVVRDVVDVNDGRVTISGVGFVGGLTADRVIGAPERVDQLGGAGSFDSGTLTGWTLVGSGTTAGIVAGGVDGTHKAWVKGIPDGDHYLELRHRLTSTAQAWGRVKITAAGYVSLPSAPLEIDDYGLVTVVVLVDGEEVWPAMAARDKVEQVGVGVVTPTMVRGNWSPDPVAAGGLLPTPPYTCDVCIRLHPVDETERTYFDGVKLYKRANTSTGTSQDLTRHVSRLMNHAQSDTSGKSTWGIQTYVGNPVGISEVGVWWHEDGQSLPEALEALCGRGMDVWDFTDPAASGRKIKAAKRRGSKRTDIRINPWDVLGVIRWQVDPGAQRSALRATSSASSVWAGADVGAIDPSATNGQIIDVVVSGPVGMTPTQLRRWAQTQLATMRVAQVSTMLLLPPKVANRLSVGDTVHVAALVGRAGLSKWMTITAKTPDMDGRFVGVDLGTEVT